MTLPDERYRSIAETQQFLIRLSQGDYPRVPHTVREEARALLRHYPGEYDLHLLESAAPHVVQQRMEPLHRMIAAHTVATAADDHEGSTTD